jgi:hypothetical protein
VVTVVTAIPFAVSKSAIVRALAGESIATRILAVSWELNILATSLAADMPVATPGIRSA